MANGQRIHCPELTGRDEQGKLLHNGHRHAQILPVDLDADGHLDHIIIYVPMGLGEAAQHAISGCRTWTKGSVGELQLAIAGSGDLNVLRSLPSPLDQRIDGLLGPPKDARWASATPFVPPRFLKRRGANTLLGQITAELTSRGLPPVGELGRLSISAKTWAASRHFVRRRQRGGAPPPVDVGLAL